MNEYVCGPGKKYLIKLYSPYLAAVSTACFWPFRVGACFEGLVCSPGDWFVPQVRRVQEYAIVFAG